MRHGQPGLRHVPQADPAGDLGGALHGGVVQHRAAEAAVLLGDLLGEARPDGASPQGGYVVEDRSNARVSQSRRFCEGNRHVIFFGRAARDLHRARARRGRGGRRRRGWVGVGAASSSRATTSTTREAVAATRRPAHRTPRRAAAPREPRTSPPRAARRHRVRRARRRAARAARRAPVTRVKLNHGGTSLSLRARLRERRARRVQAGADPSAVGSAARDRGVPDRSPARHRPRAAGEGASRSGRGAGRRRRAGATARTPRRGSRTRRSRTTACCAASCRGGSPRSSVAKIGGAPRSTSPRAAQLWTAYLQAGAKIPAELRADASRSSSTCIAVRRR